MVKKCMACDTDCNNCLHVKACAKHECMNCKHVKACFGITKAQYKASLCQFKEADNTEPEVEAEEPRFPFFDDIDIMDGDEEEWIDEEEDD